MSPVLLLLTVLLAFAVSVGLFRVSSIRRVTRGRQRNEDALKHMFEEQYRGRQASLSSLGGVLRLSGPTVLALVTNMQRQGLVSATGQTFSLTPEGERLALQIVRAHRLLERYFADEARLPLRHIHAAAERKEHSLSTADVERLSAFYSVSYETIGHRLSTLQRPSMRGVPLSFVRVDRAGNMSKRQSATGFHFSSSGGTCPLWNVYETFANPGKILVQITQMPDGRNYMWVARTVERRASRYGQPGKTFAIGLGCELRHAHRLVYSEGLDLSGDNATPIGAGCRVCERDNCPQRAFPALGRALDIDEHRSTVSPYLVKQS